jgi:OOP family OmpA-OmpF porin
MEFADRMGNDLPPSPMGVEGEAVIRIDSIRLGVLLPCLVVLAVACVKDLPSQSPVATSPLRMDPSQWRVIDNVFVVTDASGTMYQAETFPEAKAHTQSFVAAMPDADAPARNPGIYNAGLIGFGGDDRIAVPLSGFDRAVLSRAASDLAIMGSIDGTGGETPFRKIFGEIAAALEGRGGPAAVVIFSDGLADYPPVALAVAAGLAEMVPDGICFHAVQTGSDPVGRDFLGSVTELTHCGTLRSASTLDSSGAFAEFSNTVFAGAAPPPPMMAGPCDGVIRLRGVNFAFDKADITDDSTVILDVAIEQLNKCPDLSLFVDGHTDWTGPEEYNMGLSERRAAAVRNYLVANGISSHRLTPRGFGESQPIAPNDTRDGRAMNRRTELKQQ